MRTADNLEKIESQIMNLPVSEQTHLIERIARREHLGDVLNLQTYLSKSKWGVLGNAIWIDAAG